MDYCKICGEPIWASDGKHRCPPKWEIWDDDNRGDEYAIVFAHDAEAAGAKYAEESDADDRVLLCDGEEQEVKIREAGDEEWRTFFLTGEVTSLYHALEKKNV